LITDDKDITPSVYVEELLNGAAKTGRGIAQSEDENKTEDEVIRVILVDCFHGCSVGDLFGH